MYSYRNYSYLNTETLYTIADETGSARPTSREITERKNHAKEGGAKLGPTAIGVQGSINNAFEHQETYKLTQDERSFATQTINSLIDNNDAFSFGGLTERALPQLRRGMLLEITGSVSITSTSAFATLYQHFNPIIQTAETPQDLELTTKDIRKIAKGYLLTSEMPKIPLLYRSKIQGILAEKGISVYINFIPGYFIQSENNLNLDDEITVFGFIEKTVRGGDEGYMDASAWMFPNLNPRVRKAALAQKDLPDLEEILGELHSEITNWENPDYIKGPAIVVRAIALY